MMDGMANNHTHDNNALLWFDPKWSSAALSLSYAISDCEDQNAKQWIVTSTQTLTESPILSVSNITK